MLPIRMPPRFAGWSGRTSQARLLGAFLFLTVLLAGWLGYEALAAAGSHRRTAEAVLTDYAEISLASFADAADDGLDDFLDEALGSIDRELADFDDPLPNPREIAWEMDEAAAHAGCRACPALERPLLVFTAEPERGDVRGLPDSVPRARVLALARRIGTATPAAPDGRYGQGILLLPGGAFVSRPVVVGYGRVSTPESDRTRVMGFVLEAGALEEAFARWFQRRRLLPEPIGGELPNDSLLQVTVKAPDGGAVWASPVAYSGTVRASRSLGAESGGLHVEVAIRPDQASQLIIGGLPSSRLPLLLTLLVLTLGVGAAALVQFRREAELQRFRDDFVSGVSHELRTPLAQIRIFAELQESGKLATPEDRRRATTVIHRESRRLSHLVDNILQFSRMRHAGGPRMPREELDLADALDDGIGAMETLLRERGMSLELDAESGVHVLANREALTRVVVNLLDNASKYGPEGQQVRVEVRRIDGQARLAVEDQGPGVPPAERQRVWQPYRRLERDVKARLPGTGIGLSVVAELVAAHGGRAWIEDAPEGGARFVAELPLAETLAAREREVALPAASPEASAAETSPLDDGVPRSPAEAPARPA